ncbi:hypothetical protein AAG906_007169 [Vitis piasezkii]
MVLIPKKGGVDDLKDFRPTSLVGSLYKLLAKVLANRLKKVVGKVLSMSQNAFVEGDPLSPYLFVIVMEALSCLLKRVKEGGFLLGWWFNSREVGVEISHLLFAYDTLVFCEPSLNQLTYLSWLLMWFEAMSGLKVNLEKSKLVLVRRVDIVADLAQEFGCKISVFPSSYLSLPLGAHFKDVVVWDGMEERLWKRLLIWKRRYLWEVWEEVSGWCSCEVRERFGVEGLDFRRIGGVATILKAPLSSLFAMSSSKEAWVEDV